MAMSQQWTLYDHVSTMNFCYDHVDTMDSRYDHVATMDMLQICRNTGLFLLPCRNIVQ